MSTDVSTVVSRSGIVHRSGTGADTACGRWTRDMRPGGPVAEAPVDSRCLRCWKDTPYARPTTVVAGHGLASEGAAHDDDGRRTGGAGKTGRAKCACGALSEPLDSNGARQRWHREHKQAAREEGTR